MMKPERWQQVDQLFQSALERAPEDRAAFISEACGGDESLRHSFWGTFEALPTLYHILSGIVIIDFGDAYFTPEITHFRGKDTIYPYICVLSGDGIDVTIDQSIPSPQEKIAARLEDFVTMAFHTSSNLIPATTLFSNATFTVSEITRAISHPSTRNIGCRLQIERPDGSQLTLTLPSLDLVSVSRRPGGRCEIAEVKRISAFKKAARGLRVSAPHTETCFRVDTVVRRGAKSGFAHIRSWHFYC